MFAVFAPDGKSLAVENWDDVVLYDVVTGKEVRRLAGEGHGGRLYSAAFAPDGTVYAAEHDLLANYSADQLAVFQIGTSGGLTLTQLVPTGRRPEHVLLHPSGAFLYVASAGTVTLPSTISAYAVAPDGSLAELLPATVAAPGAYRLALIRPAP